MRDDADDDPTLAATVAAVWRQARVSCPHPDLLSSWLQGGVDGAAARFLDFHLGESDCPACNAVVEDLRARDDRAGRPEVDAAGVRALRSTLTALRSQRG
jgi:hypothetical protein